jgi:hypothetical protein
LGRSDTEKKAHHANSKLVESKPLKKNPKMKIYKMTIRHSRYILIRDLDFNSKR